MSDMEYHKGTLIKAFDENVSFEDGIQSLAKTYSIDDIDIDIEDEYLYSDTVHYINGEFYVIENHLKFDPDSMLDSSVNDDGSIEFLVSFYNGGTSLSEMLEDIISNAVKL